MNLKKSYVNMAFLLQLALLLKDYYSKVTMLHSSSMQSDES